MSEREVLRDKNGLTEEEYLKSYSKGDYPSPSLTADIAVFAEDKEEIYLLLIKRGGHPYIGRWALPGGFAEPNESIEETAERELYEETGLESIRITATGFYSAPGRDPRGWVVTRTFGARVKLKDVSPKAGDDAREVEWFRVSEVNEDIILTRGDTVIEAEESSPFLAFDHGKMIRDAVKVLRIFNS